MVKWSKLHNAENLKDMADDISEAQFMAFAIGDVIDFSSFVILHSGFKVDKIEAIREKFTRPSHLAEFVYKKFKGDTEAMTEFVEVFNSGGDEDGEA